MYNYQFLYRPLHLAIIHENTNLTQYLVKLIVGVYMNLDIANNMRQVQYMYMYMHVTFLVLGTYM